MINKTKLFEDTFLNVIPERVPIDVPLSFEAILQYGDINVAKSQWEPRRIAPVVREICERVHSDKAPFTRPSRTASMYKFMGSKSFVFSKADIMQHPEVCSLYPEDYDYFIEHPYDCMLERAIPRFNENIDFINEPAASMLNFAKGFGAQKVDAAEYAGATASIIAEYDYYKGFPGGASVAPVDYISDILRSFSGMSVDLRRNRQKVIDAAEAILPFLFKTGMPRVINEYSQTMYWTHMPTFMRPKDFEEVWWPSFFKICNNYAAAGVRSYPWLEDDWTRYIDYLEDLPVNSTLRFEHGDAKLYKDRLGDSFVLTGLYPATALKTDTKEQCIDKAKELLDIMAPGGGYIFQMDKVLMTISKPEMDNLCAVLDFVIEYGKYENAGEHFGKVFSKGNYKTMPTREFKSKYYTVWADVEGISPECAKKMQQNEDEMLGYVAAFFK